MLLGVSSIVAVATRVKPLKSQDFSGKFPIVDWKLGPNADD